MCHTTAGKQSPQSCVFFGNFARGALHVLCCCDAFEFILLDALLEVLDQLLALVARAPLVLPDPNGCWRVISLPDQSIARHVHVFDPPSSTWLRLGVTCNWRRCKKLEVDRTQWGIAPRSRLDFTVARHLAVVLLCFLIVPSTSTTTSYSRRPDRNLHKYHIQHFRTTESA